MSDSIAAFIGWSWIMFCMGWWFGAWREGGRWTKMKSDKFECHHEAGVWTVTDGNGVALEDEELIRLLQRLEKAQEELKEIENGKQDK